MANLAIGFGGALIVLGLAAYGYGAMIEGEPHFTALIPAFFGLPVLICGLIALKEAARKHAMHAAVLVALLGLIGALQRPISKAMSGELVINLAFWSQIAMAVLCLVFLVMAVKSFIDARRRQAENAT